MNPEESNPPPPIRCGTVRPMPSPSLIRSGPLAVIGDQSATGDRQRRENAVDRVASLDGISRSKAGDIGRA